MAFVRHNQRYLLCNDDEKFQMKWATSRRLKNIASSWRRSCITQITWQTSRKLHSLRRIGIMYSTWTVLEQAPLSEWIPQIPNVSYGFLYLVFCVFVTNICLYPTFMLEKSIDVYACRKEKSRKHLVLRYC